MSRGGVGESGGDCLELSSLHKAAPLLGMLPQLNLFRFSPESQVDGATAIFLLSFFLSLFLSFFFFS